MISRTLQFLPFGCFVLELQCACLHSAPLNAIVSQHETKSWQSWLHNSATNVRLQVLHRSKYRSGRCLQGTIFRPSVALYLRDVRAGEFADTLLAELRLRKLDNLRFLQTLVDQCCGKQETLVVMCCLSCVRIPKFLTPGMLLLSWKLQL